MTEHKIRYAPEAMRDMERIWDDVYAVSKEYDVADRYVEEFIRKIETKRLFPHSGAPLLHRGLFTGFYSIGYKKYKAFYRVRDGYMEILRIIMAKQDYMKILFDETQ